MFTAAKFFFFLVCFFLADFPVHDKVFKLASPLYFCCQLSMNLSSMSPLMISLWPIRNLVPLPLLRNQWPEYEATFSNDKMVPNETLHAFRQFGAVCSNLADEAQ